MSSGPSSSNGTFRDPQGRLFRDGDRILREVYPQSVPEALAWLRSPLAQRWVQQRKMVSTQILASESGETALLEHERISFPSYPWEWTPGQWAAAASLTLDLCEEALAEGLILKDATPLNILFSGPHPIFVDVLSFEPRDPKSPIWLAYAQFVRTFLLPLSAYVYLGWPLAATMQRRDGYEPADLAPFLSFFRRWRAPLRSLVAMPMLLEKKTGVGAKRPQVAEDVSAYLLRRLLRSTRKMLGSLAPSIRDSRWSAYTETAAHYQSTDHEGKQAFVRSGLESIRPANVLDVGGNTGVYSRIAAQSGANVMAWDLDVQAADINWQTATREGLSILPMIANFARPTPAVGWRNRENASLLDRAKGQFDCVMMLGVLHHLLVSDQIPLDEIFDQLWDISRKWAILEWIPIGDSQFDELCRGREELYSHLTEQYFVETVSRKSKVIKHDKLPNGRSLWIVEKIT